MPAFKSIRKVLYLLTAIPVLLLLACLILFQSDIPTEKLKQKYADESSRFMSLLDMSVHYKDEGQGPAIVLIHGTGASLHTWDAWARTLKSDYRVVRMDIPAFGLTGPHPERDYSIDAYRRFIIAFLDELQIDTCILVGNSLGGRIAWHIAAKHAPRVSSLGLINSAGFPTASTKLFEMAQKPLSSFLIKKITPRRLVKENLEQVYFNDKLINDELVDRYWQMARREGNRQAFIDRARTEYIEETNLLSDIKCPVLVIWGKHDAWIPVSHASKFKNMIPHCKLAILEKAGHVPMEELPEESLNQFVIFLNEQ